MTEYMGVCLWNGIYLAGYQASNPRNAKIKLERRASVIIAESEERSKYHTRPPFRAAMANHTKP
jgi:hypothetical protein